MSNLSSSALHHSQELGLRSLFRVYAQAVRAVWRRYVRSVLCVIRRIHNLQDHYRMLLTNSVQNDYIWMVREEGQIFPQTSSAHNSVDAVLRRNGYQLTKAAHTFLQPLMKQNLGCNAAWCPHPNIHVFSWTSQKAAKWPCSLPDVTEDTPSTCNLLLAIEEDIFPQDYVPSRKFMHGVLAKHYRRVRYEAGCFLSMKDEQTNYHESCCERDMPYPSMYSYSYAWNQVPQPINMVPSSILGNMYTLGYSMAHSSRNHIITLQVQMLHTEDAHAASRTCPTPFPLLEPVPTIRYRRSDSIFLRSMCSYSLRWCIVHAKQSCLMLLGGYDSNTTRNKAVVWQAGATRINLLPLDVSLQVPGLHLLRESATGTCSSLQPASLHLTVVSSSRAVGSGVGSTVSPVATRTLINSQDVPRDVYLYPANANNSPAATFAPWRLSIDIPHDPLLSRKDSPCTTYHRFGSDLSFRLRCKAGASFLQKSLCTSNFFSPSWNMSFVRERSTISPSTTTQTIDWIFPHRILPNWVIAFDHHWMPSGSLRWNVTCDSVDRITMSSDNRNKVDSIRSTVPGSWVTFHTRPRSRVRCAKEHVHANIHCFPVRASPEYLGPAGRSTLDAYDDAYELLEALINARTNFEGSESGLGWGILTHVLPHAMPPCDAQRMEARQRAFRTAQHDSKLPSSTFSLAWYNLIPVRANPSSSGNGNASCPRTWYLLGLNLQKELPTRNPTDSSAHEDHQSAACLVLLHVWACSSGLCSRSEQRTPTHYEEQNSSWDEHQDMGVVFESEHAEALMVHILNSLRYEIT